MIEPWNDATLLPPPINTTYGTFPGVHQIRYICNEIIKVLTNQSPLHTESAILSRFIYKFDKKFRNDIGYKNFKKVNTALRRYLKVNLLKDIQSFRSLLPSHDDNYIPTKQMLEYVLVRLITFSKLMMRIFICSKKSAIFYLDRVKRGESHWMSLMPYALLCRIWSLATVLMQRSNTWYNQLHTFLGNLQLKGVDFLPQGYELPENLEEWENVKNIDDFGRLEWSLKKKLNMKHFLTDDDDGNTFDNMLEYIRDVNGTTTEVLPETVKEPIEMSSTVTLPTNNIDIGETISRDQFKTLATQFPLFHKHIQKPTSKHLADNVRNNKTLEEFINTEETLRYDGNKQSLTLHLSFMQWQLLKNSLNALVDSLSINRKIERKFKKIWKEKCLDYL